MADDPFFRCKPGCIHVGKIHRVPIDCWTQKDVDRWAAHRAKGPQPCHICGLPGVCPIEHLGHGMVWRCGPDGDCLTRAVEEAEEELAEKRKALALAKKKARAPRGKRR